MMRSYIWQVILGLVVMTFGSALSANPRSEKTLFGNGFYAAGFGDILLDQGQVWDQTYTALRLKAGFQLVRLGEFSLSIGYSKTGFYDAIWSKEDQVEGLQIDYHGPIAEIVILPSYPFTINIGGMFSGQGKSYQKASELPAPYLLQSGIRPEDEHKIKAQLSVQEIHLGLAYKFYRDFQFILGGGLRQIDSSYRYSRCRADDGTSDGTKPCSEALWPEDSSFSRADDHPFFFIGIRGSHL